MDSKGQISLEYLMIFAVSLILLIAFTLPLSEIAIQDTLDVSNSLNAKSELSKLSNAINQVYSEGHGSKQTLYLDMDNSLTVKIANSYLSASVRLHDGSYKQLKIYYNSNLDSGSLFLDKGMNRIIVEWPINEENMQLYKRY